jgi:hypothetical protein
MPNPSIQNTKNKLAQLYAAGILAFSAIVGTLTLVVLFVSHLNTN